MRTFVFISDIPDFLLQPVHSAAEASGGAQGRHTHRDPRYERLRRLLADHSSGVMLVMHLETKGYGLALYASEEEALDACKATITPEQPNQQYSPLRLRIVEREQPPPPEAVYHPTICIEGEEVEKESLATTRGLELCYRGKAVPRWCGHTKANEDCPLGMACHKIHKKACQRTVRKRPRIEDEDEEENRSEGGASRAMSEVERAQVDGLLRSRARYEAVLIPSAHATSSSSGSNSSEPAMRLLPAVYVSVRRAELRNLLRLPSQASPNDNNNRNSDSDAALQELSKRVQAAIDAHNKDNNNNNSSANDSANEKLTAPYYIRLSCPGGSPWDWSLYDKPTADRTSASASKATDSLDKVLCHGLEELRGRCPMPARGTPTPLERDVLIQQLWYHMNAMNRFASVPQALQALRTSARVREAFAAYCEEQAHGHRRHDNTAHTSRGKDDGEEDEEDMLQLCVQPWLYLPTVGCEVSAFIEHGGQRMRGLVQRYGQQRLMLPLTTPPLPLLLQEHTQSDVVHVNEVLQRFALVGTDTDPALEERLTQEVGVLNKRYGQAASSLCRFLSAQSTRGRLPREAAWCAQLALVLPQERNTQGNNNKNKENEDDMSTVGDALRDVHVVVLSYKPYQRALEECPLYTSLTKAGQESSNSNEVSWNLHRHHFVPLLDRSLLERLRPDA